MSFWESRDKCVKKEIIRKGNFSEKPTELAKCTIFVDKPQTAGLSISQVKYDFHSEIIDKSSKKFSIIGEACSTIDRYIERAIQTMSVNEKSLITVRIPYNKEQIVVVSVIVTLESVEFHKPIWKWIPEEKYEIALKYKQSGVDLFKYDRIIDAFYRFSKACKILITLEPLEDEELELETIPNSISSELHLQKEKQHSDRKELNTKIRQLKNTLYNNMAECQLIKKNYEHTVTLCNKVLNIDKNNVKALYRRGIAYGNLRDFEKAVLDLKTVTTLAPKDKIAQEKYCIYNRLWLTSIEESKNIMRKMFKT